MEGFHPEVAAVLERMPQDAAQNAEAGFHWMVGEGAPGDVTQSRLQEFLWYVLPRKFLTDTAHHQRIAQDLGQALELLRMERYARICRSPETAEILAAWGRDDSEGFEAFRRARERSGVEPPDTELLTWGSTMGIREMNLMEDLAATLEARVEAGDLQPGARGWKAAREALTVEWLRTPNLAVDGATPLRAIREERIEGWLSHRGEQRRSLLEPLVPRLVSPEPPGPAELESMEPLRWLLERIGEGQALTARGNLSTRLVVEAAERFGGWQVYGGRPRSEDDVPELRELHDLALGLRAVRRTGRRVVLTRAGTALAADRPLLWGAVCRHLGSRERGFEGTARTLSFAVLLRDSRVDHERLEESVAPLLQESGWHRRDQPFAGLDQRSVTWGIAAGLRLPRSLGWLEEGPWSNRWIELTEAGGAGAIETLAAEATAPGRYPGD